MSGTREGGLKSYQKNLKNQGPDFMKSIAAMGGKKGKKDGAIKGFAKMDKQKLQRISSLGGKISNRGPAKTKTKRIFVDYQASLTFPTVNYERIGWLERLRRRFNYGK